MDSLPPQKRRFGDKEIAKILERASELQRATPARPDPSGLSLAELEEIALEAGIDVENVRRAVSELDSGEQANSGEAFLGAPTKLRYERIVPGELETDDFGRMLPILNSITSHQGQPNVVGRTLTWNATVPASSRNIKLLVMSQDGETLIQIEEASGQLAGGLIGGIGGGSLGISIPMAVAVAQTGAVALGVGIGAGVFGGAYWLARTIYKKVWRKRQKELSGLFRDLVAFVEEAATKRAALPAGAAEALMEGEPGASGG